MSKDRGAKLSKHAKERLKERYGITSSVEFMKSLHKDSVKVSESRGCKIMSFDFEGKTVQYILVEEVQKVKVVKTFIPDTFEGNLKDYAVDSDSYNCEQLQKTIEGKDRLIRHLNRKVKGLEKQIQNDKNERRKFFDKSFIKSFRYFYENRRGYLKGTGAVK